MTSRVLILRDRARAAGLIERLEREGVEARAVAVTATEPLAPPRDARLAAVRWVVLTSPRAAERFAAVAPEARPPLPPRYRLATLAAGTARAATAALQREPDLAAGATGEELADALLAAGAEGPLLWPCAETTAGGLPDRLAAAGRELIRWPLYRTGPRDAAATATELRAAAPWQAAVLAAPSQVRAFAAAWNDPWAVPCVAIGPTTAAALREHGCPAVVTAAAPDEESLCTAVLQALDRP